MNNTNLTGNLPIIKNLLKEEYIKLKKSNLSNECIKIKLESMMSDMINNIVISLLDNHNTYNPKEIDILFNIFSKTLEAWVLEFEEL